MSFEEEALLQNYDIPKGLRRLWARKLVELIIQPIGIVVFAHYWGWMPAIVFEAFWMLTNVLNLRRYSRL